MMRNFSPDQKNCLYTRIFFFISAIILVSLACNAPTAAKRDASGEELPLRATDTLEVSNESDSSDAPEVSETPTLTPTITETPTPEVARVYSSENTNCRTGPNTAFSWIFTLKEGEEAEAVAKGPYGEYWYIKQPDQPSTICALWGKYATPSGPYDSLPVWTPIPTPTQSLDYKVGYHSNIGNCGTFWTLQYRIDNIGGFTLESWRTMSTDHTGGAVPLENIQDKFYDVTGCSWNPGVQEDLTPGEAYYLNAGFDNNPVGHDITVKIKICTENGLGGQCLVKNYRHTP
jgi:hypothetical protein